jgi:hypothetical protein
LAADSAENSAIIMLYNHGQMSAMVATFAGTLTPNKYDAVRAM